MVESIAVVGASLAGIRTVEALRRQGFVGRITVIGAEDEPQCQLVCPEEECIVSNPDFEESEEELQQKYEMLNG